MADDRTKICTSCGGSILFVTAEATGGLCRPCLNRRAIEANRTRHEEERQIGLARLTRAEFHALCEDPSLERACHVVFEKASWKWTERGVEALTEGETTVLAVETLFGEVCNGGFLQYLDHEPGCFAPQLPDALGRVGLEDFAVIARRLLALFPGPLPVDSDERSDFVEEALEVLGDEALEELDDEFFELYHHGGADRFRARLHRYVTGHAEEFVLETAPN